MKKIIALSLTLLAAACTKPADRPAVAKKGEPAPQVKVEKFLRGDLKALNGWDDLKGKAVVIEFWGTYCEPCIEHMPHMNGLAEKFKDKPVVFISLSRESADKVEEFLKSHDLKGNVAADAGAAFQSFSVRGIPHTVLIDKDSRVQAFTYPTEVTEQTIEDLLAGKQLASRQPAAEPVSAAPGGALASFSLAPSNGGPSMSYSDNEVKFGGITLSYAIEMAMQGTTHGVEYKNVPKDLLQKNYDLVAKVGLEQENAPLKLRELVIAGLNGALPLNVAVVKKNKKVFLLKKTGAAAPGLVPFTGKGGSRSSGNDNGTASLACRGGVMSELADQLEDWLGMPVLDESGLGDKRFNFEIKVSPVDAKTVNAALEKLGLKLVEARRDVEIVEVTGKK